METLSALAIDMNVDDVRNTVNAERQWRPVRLQNTSNPKLVVRNTVNAERQWRPPKPVKKQNTPHPVRNTVNAERQWRLRNRSGHRL